MSGLEEVDVTIHPDGRVEVKVRGVSGPACLTATKKLEQYLGGKVTRELTDEFHAEVAEDQDEARTVTVEES